MGLVSFTTLRIVQSFMMFVIRNLFPLFCHFRGRRETVHQEIILDYPTPVNSVQEVS